MHYNDSFSGFVNGAPPMFKLFGGLIFLIVIGGFLFVIIKGLSTWTSNNSAERIYTPCKVVDKRTEVWGGSGDSRASTNYYVTFEFNDSTRKEFYVKPSQFGLLVIGDSGELAYQGTRFLGFNRVIDGHNNTI